ncbi:RES domain-containing protein [Providencia rettgeri]|uniref:RES domain-containing protein n=1 Tax=Providencia rettgeri TaxID=587 RepID=A0A939NE55_PRORE|nr:RES domain-containing protein [Providencia rettgeri]
MIEPRRACKSGIPVLYVGTTVRTAISEVRPGSVLMFL